MYAVQGVFIATRKAVDYDTKFLALGLSAALVGFVANTFTSNTFQHPQSGLFFWILAGVVAALGAGLWRVEPREQTSAAAAPGRVSAGSLAAKPLSALRTWLRSSWRASASFDATATPRTTDGGWFESSVFARILFGIGRTGTRKDQ
jgi:hypothetical protein